MNGVRSKTRMFWGLLLRRRPVCVDRGRVVMAAESAVIGRVVGRERSTWVALLFAATLAIILVTLALILVAVGCGGTSVPRQANATPTSLTPTAVPTSLSGTWVYTIEDTQFGETIDRGSFVLTAAGDYRLQWQMVKGPSMPTAMPTKSIEAYDARANTWRRIQADWTKPGQQTVYQQATISTVDLPAPLARHSLFSPYRDEASCVRALRVEEHPSVVIEATTYQGRPAWRARITRPVADSQATLTAGEVIVDRQTGYVLWSNTTVRNLDGSVTTNELALDDLRVNVPLAAGEFDLAKPAGKYLLAPFPPSIGQATPSLGRAATLKQATQALGARPLLPRRLPGGYRLEGISVISLSKTQHAVLVGYERGFDRFSILQSRDGFGAESGTAQQETLLTAGALAGDKAVTTVSLAPWGVPALPNPPSLAVSARSGLYMRICGDLSRRQLLEVANSLR